MTPFHKLTPTASQYIDLINLAIEKAGLRNDAALSRALEVAPPVISKIRNGKLTIGATLTIRIMDLTGLSLNEVKEVLGGGV